MIYKLQNGGIVKLQNAWTTMPTFEDAWKRSEQQRQRQKVVQEAEKRASERIDNEDKGFLANVRFSDDLTGEWSKGANRNARMAKYVAEELGLDGNEEFLNSYIKDGTEGISNLLEGLGTTLGAGVLAGNIGTYGLLGGIGTTVGQFAGSDALNWGGGKVGGWVDKKLGTGFFEPVLSLAGLLKGWNVGGKYGYGAAKKILSNQMTRQMAKHGNMNIPKWWASKNMQRDVFLSDPYGKHVYDQWMKYNRNRQYTHPSKQLSNIDDQGYGFAFKNGGILKGQKGLSKALSGIFANASSERAASKAMSGVAKASGVSTKRPRIKVYQDLRKTAVKQTPLSTLNAEKNTAYQNKLLSENQEYQIKQTQQILDNYLQRQWTEKGVNTPGWMRKALMKAIGINPLASTPPFETPYTTGYRSWYRNGQPLMFEGEPVKDWMNASGDYFNIGPHSEMFQAVKPLKSASNYFDIVGQNVKGEAYQTNMDMFKEGLQNLVDLYFK